MSTPLKTIFISEFILVFIMVIGIAPQELAYLILVLLVVSFIRLSMLDSLKLFILSVPFFVALPANALSDSMSIWRFLILVLVLKAGWEKYCWFHSPPVSQYGINSWLWNRCARLLNNGKRFHINTLLTHLKSGIIGTMEPTYLQKSSTALKGLWSQRLLFLTVIFFIIASISLISAQDVGMGIKKMLFLLNIFLLFPVVIFTIKKESDLKEVFKALLCLSLMIVFIGYFQFVLTFFFTLSQFWYFWTDNVIKAFYGQNLSHLLSYSNTWFSYYKSFPPTLRMFSVLPDSHSFAMITTISIPLVLSFLFLYEKKKKKYMSIVLIFFLLAIFFSGSRGAWVGSIFALAACVILFISSSIRIKNNSKFERIYLAIIEFKKLLKSKVGFNFNIENNSKYYSKLIVFSVLLFFLLMPVSSLILRQNQETQLIRSNISLTDKNENKFSMFERAFSITDFSETSNKGRLQIWQETLVSISEHPSMRVGFGNFNYVLGENSTALKKGSSAHSIYLDIAAEIGIFGLIIFLLLIIEILMLAYKLYFKIEKKYLKVFAGSFFVYFTWKWAYSLFDVIIFNDKVLMFVVIMIGVLYSLGRITNYEL